MFSSGCNNITLVGCFYLLKRSSVMFGDNGWRESHHKGAQLSAASWTDFADLAVTAEMRQSNESQKTNDLKRPRGMDAK